MAIIRKFINWDKPLLTKSAELLCSEADKSKPYLDLSSLLIVTSTQNSARKLKNYLTDIGSKNGSGMLAPEIVTPDFLLNNENYNIITTTERLLLWIKILKDNSKSLSALTPNLEEDAINIKNLSNIAERIIQLADLIAEKGLTIGRVYKQYNNLIAMDMDRWQDLARLEELYFEELNQAGLLDIDASKINININSKIDKKFNKIILIGISDPLPVILGALRIISKTIPVEIWVYAPESYENSFDEFGIPLQEYWTKNPINIPDWDNCVKVAQDPEDQAKSVMDILHLETTKTKIQINDSLAFCITNNDIIPYVEQALKTNDLICYNPAGKRIENSQAFNLLYTMHSLITRKNAESFSTILRNPDYLNHLSKTIPDFNYEKLITAWVNLQNQHMPESVDDIQRVLESKESPPKNNGIDILKQAFYDFKHLFSELSANSLPTNCRNILLKFYNDKSLNLDNQDDSIFIEILKIINRNLREFETVRLKHLNISTNDLNELFFQKLRNDIYYENLKDNAIVLHGWLEALWETAPVLLILGVNDEYIPSAIIGDLFIPESLKTSLGLRNNSTRFARDAYILTAITKSRQQQNGKTYLLLGKSDSRGEALKPSRLLYLCQESELLHRINSLFLQKDETNTIYQSTLPSFKLTPRKTGNIPETLNVTDFRNYLNCPFLFYLSRVLKMEKTTDKKNSIAATDFGIICHKALEHLAKDKFIRTCSDINKIKKFLNNIAEAIVFEQYGKNLSVSQLISLESIKQRLSKFAEIHIEEYNKGWTILNQELTITLALTDKLLQTWLNGSLPTHSSATKIKHIVGKIDRIDVNNETGILRIIDYKTGDHEKTPMRKHITKTNTPENYQKYSLFEHENKVFRWIDLQLPLYYITLKQQKNYESKELYCSYFYLPKAVSQTKIKDWEDISEYSHYAMFCAAQIIDNINNNVFWPPSNNKSKFINDFGEIFTEDLHESVDSSYMLGFITEKHEKY